MLGADARAPYVVLLKHASPDINAFFMLSACLWA